MYETKCTFCEGTGERLRPYEGPSSGHGLVKGPCEYCGGTGKWKHEENADKPKSRLALYIVGAGILGSLFIGLIAGIASHRDQIAESDVRTIAPSTAVSHPLGNSTELTTGYVAFSSVRPRPRSVLPVIHGQPASASAAAADTSTVDTTATDQTYTQQTQAPVSDTTRTDTSDTTTRTDTTDTSMPADSSNPGDSSTTSDTAQPSDNSGDTAGNGQGNANTAAQTQSDSSGTGDANSANNGASTSN